MDYPAFLDTLRTAIFAIGVTVALLQLRENLKLRRVQILSALNERLGKCPKARDWLDDPSKPWTDLNGEVKTEIGNYIATFEDIGLARKASIISKHDFIRSYGGRYEKLYSSSAIQIFMSEEGYKMPHFDQLNILNKDIGKI